MGPIWGRQDPGGPHVGPMNLAIWDHLPAYIPLKIFPSNTTFSENSYRYSLQTTHSECAKLAVIELIWRKINEQYFIRIENVIRI